MFGSIFNISFYLISVQNNRSQTWTKLGALQAARRYFLLSHGKQNSLDFLSLFFSFWLANMECSVKQPFNVSSFVTSGVWLACINYRWTSCCSTGKPGTATDLHTQKKQKLWSKGVSKVRLLPISQSMYYQLAILTLHCCILDYSLGKGGYINSCL